MVQAVINITKEANQILNIVKARHSLKDKSHAINLIAVEYGHEILEPELRPEYIEKLGRIAKEKSIHIGAIGDFKRRYSRK